MSVTNFELKIFFYSTEKFGRTVGPTVNDDLVGIRHGIALGFKDERSYVPVISPAYPFNLLFSSCKLPP